MTGIAWTATGFEGIARLLGVRAGLSFTARPTDAEAAIQRSMTRVGLSDLCAYLGRLESDDRALDELIDEITVGETYFFRQPEHFSFIRDEVLREIRRRRGSDVICRAWSAGCASGEEAYSLAILVEEEGLERQTHLLGTDISRRALARARQAEFRGWSLRGLDDARVQRYFRREGDRFALADRFRARVAFEYLNLALDRYPSLAAGTCGLDLILCRNVFLYLDAQTIARIGQRLLDCLAVGGWLITGPSDPGLEPDGDFETVVTRGGVFYRRPAEHHPPPTPRPTVFTKPEPDAATPRAASIPSAAEPLPPPLEPLADAERAFARGRYSSAAQLAGGIPSTPASCTLRVRALVNSGRDAAAEQAAAEAVSLHPLSPELHFLRGILFLRRGRQEEALLAVRQALYLDRSLALAHFVLGSILRRHGNPSGAQRAYRNALDLCLAVPPDQPIPLSDGEPAGRLAEAARIEMALTEQVGEAVP
jgi:chemotaxis protein methyltransferase CheR